MRKLITKDEILNKIFYNDTKYGFYYTYKSRTRLNDGFYLFSFTSENARPNLYVLYKASDLGRYIKWIPYDMDGYNINEIKYDKNMDLLNLHCENISEKRGFAYDYKRDCVFCSKYMEELYRKKKEKQTDYEIRRYSQNGI